MTSCCNIMYDDGKLIDLVRQYPFLYDKSEKSYRNKTEEENGWKTIANLLKTTPEECEQRWLLLRNRFCSELRKEKNIPTGSTPRQTWYMFQDLMWLKPHVIPRRGNIPAPRMSNVWDSFPQLDDITDAAEVSEEMLTEETEDIVIEGTEEIIIEQSEVPDLTQPENDCGGSSITSAFNSDEKVGQPSCSTSGIQRSKMDLKNIRNDVNKFKKSKRTDNKALGEALTGALSHFTTVISKKDEQKENRTDPEDLFGAMVAQYLRQIKDTRKKYL